MNTNPNNPATQQVPPPEAFLYAAAPQGYVYGAAPHLVPAPPPYGYALPHTGYASQQPPPTPQQETHPPNPRTRRADRMRDEAFDLVEKELTMSKELVERLPKFVRDWTPEHVLDWLREIFSGTKDLPNYVKSFTDLGVRGIDLLAAEDEDLKSFGITVPLHIARARTCINQLHNDQKRKEDIAVVQKSEQRFVDLKEKYEQRKNQVPPYLLPRKIKFWRVLDVFTFLMMQTEETEEDVSMFLKPFALAHIYGGRLNELRGQDSWEEIPDLQATDRDIKVLKSLLTTFERKEEEKFKRVMDLKKRKREAGLVTIPKESIRKKEFIDHGSQLNRIYFGTYERKKVSIKIIKHEEFVRDSKETEEQAETRRTLLEDRRMVDVKYEARMTYEASRACSFGVVKFFGVCLNAQDPMIILQYLCNKSVEHEIHAACRESEDSIFHINNDQNIRSAENGVKNPVLLQVVRIARDVASALAKLHDADIVHLDIAARNILLDATKRPKIADFGGSARESELLELYSLHKKVFDEGARLFKDDDEVQVECALATDALAREKSLLDVNTLQIYEMPADKRYVRHMPLWVLENQNNPLLDRHTDVYAFGCLIYEMVTHKIPHFDIHVLAVQEVIDRKLSGNGNPHIPASIDPRLARIMSSCWEEYDDQPSMPSIARELAELHTSMSTESTPQDQGYNKIKAYMKSPCKQESVNRGTFSAAPRRNSIRQRRDIGENMIRLDFSTASNVDPDDPIMEFQDSGMNKSSLEDTLTCALRHRDDRVLLGLLECISIENRDVQIEMISICLENIAILANDEHSSTDSDGTWQVLCEGVAKVVNTALFIMNDAPSDARGTSNNPAALSSSQRQDLSKHGLAAISALLGRKSLEDESNDDTIDEFAGGLVCCLCDVACRALVHFRGDTDVIESAAALIGRLVDLTPLATQQLHNEGVILKLLDIMRENRESHTVVLQCVEALDKFPLRILLEPRPVKMAARERAMTQKNSMLKAQEAAETLARNWSMVLQSITDAMADCTSKLRECQGNTFLTSELLGLLSACCRTIFRSCESCSLTENDVIERFFYGADSSTIESLVDALVVAPDHFRIQEGAIGALGHLLSTGHMEFTDANKPHVDMIGNIVSTPYVLVPRRTSAEERISAYLALDPTLKLLLSAMDKFRLNDKISTGIVTTTSTTGRKYSSTATMSKYGTLTKTSGKTSSELTSTNILSSFERGEEEGAKFFEAMEFDEYGERRSAASIQSNVAIVIGYACIHHKDVQQNLVRTRYNDMILTSFQNFSNDKSLIEYGCRAFYWTCRRNSMHQLMLMERKILRQLLFILKKFNDEWTVLNSVLCALLGLLEPPDEAYIPQYFPGEMIDPKEIRKTRPMLPESCIGKRVVEELLKKRENDGCLFDFIVFRVFEFISQDDTQPLTANFLRLVTSIMYWDSAVVAEWENNGVVNLADNKETMKSILLKLLIRNMGKERGLAQAQACKKEKVTKEKEKEKARSKPLKTETAPAKIAQEKQISFPAPPKGRSNDEDDEKAEERAKKAHAVMMQEFKKKNSGKETACFLTLLFVSEEIKIPLKYFVTITVNWHETAPDVLAAGLGIVLQLYQAIIITAEINDNKNYPIGCVLPYSTVENLRTMRSHLASLDFIKHCMFAKEQQLDHPILIRYSVWILLLLISEPKNEEDNFSPDNPCSDVCLAGVPEWIVEVMKRYDDFYSLQILCCMFLVRAEEQGVFINRSLETLEEMRDCATRARDRPMTEFLQLSDEGEDSFMVGQPLQAFGELQVHADRLLRAVDKHLQSVAPVAMGNINMEGTMIQMPLVVNPPPFSPAPRSIIVTSAETEENEKGERFIAYVLSVQWTEELKWSVSYRYVHFRDLWDSLSIEFAHLVPLALDELGKLSGLGVLWKRNPKLLEERKRKLQDFFDKIMMTQAKLFSPNLLKFLEVEKNVSADLITVPKRLPELRPSEQGFSVNAVASDEILGLVFAGCGVVKSGLFDRDKSKVRGSVVVYRIGEKGALSIVSQLTFNAGVVKLAWDSCRRCLCIGFLSGAISFHYLNSEMILQYCSEIDVHSSCICYLSYDLLRDSFVSVSISGMIAAYNMKLGIFSSQTTCSDVTFTTAFFDPSENVLFCGTTTSSVHIFNLNNNPPGAAIQVQTLPSDKQAPVLSVHYVESSRLLYAAFKNEIKIFRSNGSTADRSFVTHSWAPCPALALREGIIINDISCIHEGRFIYASCFSGGIAVFDMRNKYANVAVTEIAPSTVKGGVLPWNEVITKDCSTICDWLRAAGKNSSSASNRIELVRIVRSSAAVTPDEIAESILRDAEPKRSVLFSWKVPGCSQTPSPQFACCSTFLDKSRIFLIGCSDGTMSSFDVSQFLPSFSSLDTRQLEVHLAAFPRAVDTLSLIKGSVKTTRAKKHQLPLLL